MKSADERGAAEEEYKGRFTAGLIATMSLVNLLRKVNCRERQVNVAGVLYNGR